MLELFSHWKVPFLTIGLFLALGWNVVQHYQVIKLDGAYQVCQANGFTKDIQIASYQEAVKTAQEAHAKQVSALRLREQDAAKAHAESQKHMDEIMKAKIPADCEHATQWMIQQAVAFNWNNHIP